MSIFVDPNATFRIILKFKDVRNSDGDSVGIIILADDQDDPEAFECICEAKGRDFENMSAVMEACTAINHTNGKPVIQISKFCKMILMRFFVSWNIYESDESEKPIPLNAETIGNVHYKIVRSLARKWLLMTDGKVGLQ
jgi:hypothetical protein